MPMACGPLVFLAPAEAWIGPAEGRIQHHLFHVGLLLHALEKTLEVPLVAPVGVALVNHVPFSQLLGQVASGRARAGHPQQGIEKRPVRPAGATLARRHQRLDTLPLLIGESVACSRHCGSKWRITSLRPHTKRCRVAELKKCRSLGETFCLGLSTFLYLKLSEHPPRPCSESLMC
jgi:hypothetical protein